MNETDLIQAINGIDDKYLSESEEPYKKIDILRNPYGLIIIAVAILVFVVPAGAAAIRYFLHRDNVEHYISGTDMVSLKNPDVIKNLTSENYDYRMTMDSLFSDGHNAMIIFTSEAISEKGKERFNRLENGIFLPSFCVKYADGSDGPSYHLKGMDVDVPIIVTSYGYEYVEEAKTRADKRSSSIVSCKGIDLSKDVKLELFANEDPLSSAGIYFYSRDPIASKAFRYDPAATSMNDLDGIEFTVNLAPNVSCIALHDADGRQLFLSSFELYSNDPAMFPKTRLCDVTFIKDSGERMKFENNRDSLDGKALVFGDEDWACFVFGEFIDPNAYAGVEVDGVEFWK